MDYDNNRLWGNIGNLLRILWKALSKSPFTHPPSKTTRREYFADKKVLVPARTHKDAGLSPDDTMANRRVPASWPYGS